MARECFPIPGGTGWRCIKHPNSYSERPCEECPNRERKEMPFRIAFRQEGEMWNAYLAPEGMMDNAMFLGSIKLSIAKNNLVAKDAFMELMTCIVATAIEEVVGVAPEMVIREAPPEERQQ